MRGVASVGRRARVAVKKAGRPGPGTRRRLTSCEARLLRVSASWCVETDAQGLVWLSHGPRRLAIPEHKLTWVRQQLDAFWQRDQRDRGIYVAGPAVQEIRQARRMARRRDEELLLTRQELDRIRTEVRSLRTVLRTLLDAPDLPPRARQLVLGALLGAQ